MGSAAIQPGATEFNLQLKEVGSNFRLKATNQSPYIVLIAQQPEKAGFKTKATPFRKANRADWLKAVAQSLELDKAEEPWKLLAPKLAEPTSVEWLKLVESTRAYLDRKQLKWRGQEYERHLRQIELFTGSVSLSKLQEWVEAGNPQTRDRTRRLVTLKRILINSEMEPPVAWMTRVTDEISYSPSSTRGRKLPSRAERQYFVDRVPNKEWRTAFAFCATYGLRPHEIFFVIQRPNDNGVIRVDSQKTGLRFVMPIKADWVERWDLKTGKLPGFQPSMSPKQLGNRVTTQLYRYRQLAQWSDEPQTYDFRHAWAEDIYTVPEWLEKVDIEQAARMMGHSVKVHRDTYSKWFDIDRTQASFEKAVLG